MRKAQDTDGLCPASLSAPSPYQGVAALPWNYWQLSCGISGKLRLESVAALAWNTHLPQPRTDLHIQLSTRWYNAILCKAYFDAEGQEGLNRKMVGTGPYQFKERMLGQHLVLDRVPYH